MATTYIGTYNQFALEVNIELGGRYVNGVLTPPASWSGSVTQWSRHVREETARRAANMTFISDEPTPTGPTDEELLYANWQRTGGTGSFSYWVSLGKPLFYTPPPTDEELLYANWQRTGGTGTMTYWRSIGSPLYYSPPAEPEPDYKGTILRKELEFNGARALIPAANIPLGQRGLIHVIGRNNMTTSQKLGISWLMRDPDGRLVEDYKDWQTFKASPNDTHEFIGGRFDINKRGIWTIIVVLFMNPEAPIEVARYSGNLFSAVVELEEPQFSDLTATYARA